MKLFVSKKDSLILLIAIVAFLFGTAATVPAQQSTVKSQEVSEIDGVPVLLKHLPDYEQVRDQALFTTDKETLRSVTGNHPVLDVVTFPPGTEAVTAEYPQGRLVIVEYMNPQTSTETDNRIHEHLAASQQSQPVYRRIGNYSVFVFESSDAVAANALVDQVKYEKSVQWLGEDPYLLRKVERYLIFTSRDIVVSTVTVIVLGLLTSILAGIAAGFIFFRVRDQRRSSRAAFSDAGGLTRLNLDGLTSEASSK